MVKSKKSKKDKGDEADENSELIVEDAVDSSTSSRLREDKKSKKKEANAGEDSAATFHSETTKNDEMPQTKEPKKTSKKKKGNRKGDDDEDDDFDIIATAMKSKQSLDDEENDSVNTTANSKSKKSKKTKAKLLESDDEGDEPVSKKTQTRKHQSVFELLDVEEPDDMDVDDADDSDGGGASKGLEKHRKQSVEEEIIKNVQKTKKDEKGGKKKKKKKDEDDDEDDIDKMLAELELEYKGEKPKKNEKSSDDKSKELDANQEAAEAIEGEVAAEDKKKKKKKKKAQETGDHTEVDQETKSVDGTKPVDDDENAEEGGTVKTAAQKKKEKKERERQKKLAQKSLEKAKQDRLAEKEASAEPSDKLEVSSTVKDAEPAEVKLDEDEDDQEGDKKKKDKKKKKLQDKDKEEKDKKRPGKKQLLLMQEALKKIKDEEERLRQEEEAKIKAAEEAERLRLEKIQLEKEKKERRKLKEKERKDRLKAEGKLLSKTQKQQKARAAATLEALKAHGFDVPSIGEKKDKVPRLGTRIRPNKSKKNQQENVEEAKESSEPTSPTTDLNEKIIATDAEQEEETIQEKESEDEAENDEDDVKDTWDASSGSESESIAEVNDDVKVEICKKSDRQVKTKVKPDDNARKLSATTSEEESSDDDDEDDDDSDSETESDSEESDESEEDEKKHTTVNLRQRAIDRIQKRREDAEKNRSTDTLRSPIVCVLGHVDTGKTKILDKIRHTHVQDSEAGGITQQIGATMVPVYAIKEQAKMVKNFTSFEIKLPGLLIIDTPGHESFSNLRSRGSSLCDIAILVVDIMHGLEPQTIESINLLKQKKTPFIVALNKVDRLYDWKVTKNKDIRDAIKSQNRNTQMEFDQRLKEVIVQFAEQSLNAALFYDNKDTRTYVSMVPTSASTGEGMGNLLALVVELTQNMLTKRLAFTEELQATVLELKAIPGLGTTIDVILVNGRLREGDTVVLAGMDGPVVTQIRSLLMPQPLKELRVKNPYEEFKEIQAAQGVKITAKDLDKVIAGLNLLVANHPDEVEILKEEVARELHAAMSSIKLAERGVYVQASTLGSLEALLEFLRTSKIPYSGIRIGPVVKRDVMKASIMLEHDSQYAVILAFDVKIERDAQELADSLGVTIFSADIIYHLFDRFIEYRERLKQQKRDEFKHIAVFPCKLRILPQFIFNSRDPIVLGVSVEAGVVKEGTPICVPTKEALEIGIVTTIEINHKTIDTARKGQEVCIKIEPIPGDSPKMYGRHFDETDMLVSKITRQSIDACKEYFRDDLSKMDWQLMIELKKLFQIL